MARDSDNLARSLDTEDGGGVLTGFLAEEDQFDRRSLWRLGSWGFGAVGAVIVAVLANQSAIGLRREQVASADLARQSQQIQSIAKESQHETRRLASAIDTLNGDRDRLYSRITVLEQGLDSVTGAIARPLRPLPRSCLPRRHPPRSFLLRWHRQRRRHPRRPNRRRPKALVRRWHRSRPQRRPRPRMWPRT
jgi:hypothetical protein